MAFLMKVDGSLSEPFRSFLADGPPVGETTTLGVVDCDGPDFRSAGDVTFFREGGIAEWDEGFLIERRDGKWIVAAQLAVRDIGEEGHDRWRPVYQVVDRDFSTDDVAELCAAYEHISAIPHFETNGKGMMRRSFLPLDDADFEEIEWIINRHPVYLSLEYDNPSSLGEEVAYDSRAGCSVGVYEVDGLFFVEWSAYEGLESGWDEIAVTSGPGQEVDLRAHISRYLDLYSDTKDPKEEDFGLVNDVVSSELKMQAESLVGSVIFHCFDDSQLPGVQIWATEDGSFAVTRKRDGVVLGGYPDLDTIRARLTSPHASYRPYLVSPDTGDWEAWD